MCSNLPQNRQSLLVPWMINNFLLLVIACFSHMGIWIGSISMKVAFPEALLPIMVSGASLGELHMSHYCDFLYDNSIPVIGKYQTPKSAYVNH